MSTKQKFNILDKILQGNLIGYIITSRKLQILYMNPFAQKLLSVKSRRYYELNLQDFLFPNYLLEEILERLKQGEKVEGIELQLGKDSSKIGLFDVELLEAENNEVDGFLFSFVDISDKKKIYQELLRAQKMEGIGLLAGGITHDFNNILGSISGYAELLKSMLNDPQLIEMVSVIEHESSKAARLISSLLQYARGTKNPGVGFNLMEVVQSSYTLLRKTLSAAIQFELEIDEHLPQVKGDAVEIQQCLINLFLNARDAMPDGGKLTIRAFVQQKPHPESKNNGKPMVCIEVKDTGSGIPDEIKDKIFEPFFSTKNKPGSSGLGLYMVKRIVTDNSGYVEVDDNVPSGAIFRIFLPSFKGETSQSDLPSSEEVLDGQNRQILIVDDEEGIVLLLKQFLEQMNFFTIISHNGMEALEIFQEKHGEIDLVLLDYMMPLKNGLEVYKQMKVIDDQVPVVLLTGVEDENVMMEFIGLGISGIIRKPFTVIDLIRKIKAVL